MSDEVDLFTGRQARKFLQIDTIILHGDGQVFQKCLKKKFCNVLTVSEKRRKKFRDESRFCM